VTAVEAVPGAASVRSDEYDHGMKQRNFGRTGWSVSAVGFGAWAIGGTWGPVDDDESLAALHAAVDEGVTFIDTADVYGAGRSERLVSRLVKERSEEIRVATKAGRFLDPHVASAYTPQAIESFIDQSLVNLGVETLDLVQLHCPPTEVYYTPELFGGLDEIKRKGKILHYGVSVERVEEALKAIEYPGVESVQIIFNMFRQRPGELFFGEAKKRNVAILARVPLASGLLTGKMTRDSTFAEDDHRTFNRHGEAFDVGETFSGVAFETGLRAVEELRALKPRDISMAQFALQWILSFDAVSTVIPGAKTPGQARDNAAAGDLDPLPEATMRGVAEIYDRLIRDQVHHRW
jgi:aryl-alcohol dehydrogenase-like predicted oxidoreductase